MTLLLRLVVLIALVFAPVMPVAPAMAQSAMSMSADCHDAAPAQPDCCNTGDHLCCPAAVAALPSVAVPVVRQARRVAWPEIAMRSIALAAVPLDQPPRA